MMILKINFLKINLPSLDSLFDANIELKLTSEIVVLPDNNAVGDIVNDHGYHGDGLFFVPAAAAIAAAALTFALANNMDGNICDFCWSFNVDNDDDIDNG